MGTDIQHQVIPVAYFVWLAVAVGLAVTVVMNLITMKKRERALTARHQIVEMREKQAKEEYERNRELIARDRQKFAEDLEEHRRNQELIVRERQKIAEEIEVLAYQKLALAEPESRTLLPHDFVCRDVDHQRGNKLDDRFMRAMRGEVYRVFECRCCHCGDPKDLQLDHFAVPKSLGGNFVLRRTLDRSLQLNVAVLCGSCNSRRGATDFREFYSSEQLDYIKDRLTRLAVIISHDSAFLESVHGFYDDDALMVLKSA